jgi:hypothetical protein
MCEEGRKRILVMPEYGMDVPLWDRSDYPQSTAGEVAGLSPQLVERLRAWNEQWLDAHDRPEKLISRWSAAEAHAWTQLGYRLAWQLQAELPDVEILIADDSGNDAAIKDIFGA